METLRDLDIVRALAPAPELRAADEANTDSLGLMEIRFSPFDKWYEIDSWYEGKFLERTTRGAFTKTIKERRDQVKVLYDHGYDVFVGNKILGTIEDLREDPDSPVGEVDLFDTSYNRDLLPGLKAGAYGSSFRFRVIKDEWNDEPGKSKHNPDGLPERTIREIRLFEFGPVTWPANPDATAGMRSLTDLYYEKLRSRDPKMVADLHERVRSLRTPQQQNAAADVGTAAPVDAAPLITDEPVSDHSVRTSTQLKAAIRLRGI